MFRKGFFRNKELSEKEKKKLLRSVKRKLTFLKKHFSSVYLVIQKNPVIWDKKIKDTEKELEKILAFYEKVSPLLFRKKSGKSQKKKLN